MADVVVEVSLTNVFFTDLWLKTMAIEAKETFDVTWLFSLCFVYRGAVMWRFRRSCFRLVLCFVIYCCIVWIYIVVLCGFWEFCFALPKRLVALLKHVRCLSVKNIKIAKKHLNFRKLLVALFAVIYGVVTKFQTRKYVEDRDICWSVVNGKNFLALFIWLRLNLFGREFFVCFQSVIVIFYFSPWYFSLTVQIQKYMTLSHVLLNKKLLKKLKELHLNILDNTHENSYTFRFPLNKYLLLIYIKHFTF